MPFLPRSSTHLLSAALAALLTASSTVALAQDPAALSAAQALVDEGNRAASAGDFQTALDRFSAAYARYKSPPILLNIATAMRRLGRNAEAGDLFARYLREPGANPQRVGDVRRQLGEIDSMVGKLTISSTDPGARVWLDGHLLPGFPNGGTVRVEPGEHTVAGGREAAVVSEVVRVEARDSRTVWLRTPGVAPRAPAVVYDEPPPPPQRRRSMRRPMSGQRIAGIVLDTVGGLGIATGFGLGIGALGVQGSANDHCLGGGNACEPRALQLEAQARHIGQAATVCLGVGAGVLVTGLIIGGTAPRYDVGSRRGPRVAVGPGSIVVEGSW